MREIHLTRKDFRLTWFSGTGAGGQYRNKHQNCCRIEHIETGITATGQTERGRVANQSAAFKELARRLIAHYACQDARKPSISNETVRHYSEPRNEVLDAASGLRGSYREIVERGNLGDMIEARKAACEEQ